MEHRRVAHDLPLAFGVSEPIADLDLHRQDRDGRLIGRVGRGGLGAPWVRLPALAAHSITWSARASSDGGIVRPRALAVLRLMIRSYFVGCSIGRSPGLAPFRI